MRPEQLSNAHCRVPSTCTRLILMQREKRVPALQIAVGGCDTIESARDPGMLCSSMVPVKSGVMHTTASVFRTACYLA